MNLSLKEFAYKQLEGAQKIIRQGKELVPVFIFENTDTTYVTAVPRYDTHREAAQFAMKELLREKAAMRYCFVMEAWFGNPPTAHDQDYRPSKDPKRLECIAISAQAKDGEKVFLFVEIKRGKKGLVQFEEKCPDGGTPLGPLTDLFGLDTKQ